MSSHDFLLPQFASRKVNKARMRANLNEVEDGPVPRRHLAEIGRGGAVSAASCYRGPIGRREAAAAAGAGHAERWMRTAALLLRRRRGAEEAALDGQRAGRAAALQPQGAALVADAAPAAPRQLGQRQEARTLRRHSRHGTRTRPRERTIRPARGSCRQKSDPDAYLKITSDTLLRQWNSNSAVNLDCFIFI